MNRITLVIVCLLALAGSMWFGIVKHAERDVPVPEIAGFVYPEPKALGEIDLIDHDGKPFDVSRFKDKWTFLYLGYTYCPDICPLTLSQLNKVEQKLAADDIAKNMQYVLVSVDPRRDTPARLREYTHYFNPKFLSATGSNDAIASFAQQLSMVFIPVDENETSDDYIVDHSSTLALIDPNGQLHAMFSSPHTAKDIEEGFRKIRKRWNVLIG